MTISKYKILFVILITVIGAGALYNIFSNASPDDVGFRTSSQVYDHNYYFDLYDVEVLDRTDAEIAYPFWVAPNPEQNITDINHRVDTLPYAQDKNRYGYVVYPKHGLTVPLDVPITQDLEKIQAGQSFDHYPYLEKGALHYRGVSPEEGNGNMVIAAHSSFGKSEPGRYKTAFQVLPISRAGEHIFVYIQNDAGSYDMYDYIINESFRSSMYNTEVLAQPTDNKQLTTYGCYVIGSNTERWVNQATLVSTISNLVLNPNKLHASVDHNTQSNIAQQVDGSTQDVSIPDGNLPVKPTGSEDRGDGLGQSQRSEGLQHTLYYKQEVDIPSLKQIPHGGHAVAQESKPEIFIHQVPAELTPAVDQLVVLIKEKIGNNQQLDVTIQYRLDQKIGEYKSQTSDSAKLRTEILKYIKWKLYPSSI